MFRHRTARAGLTAGLLFAPLLSPLVAYDTGKATPPATEANDQTPDEANFPFVIRIRTESTGDFRRGDQLKIIEVRGNRKRIEPGGSYMVKGTYSLDSAPTGTLALSLTTSSRSGRSEWGRWQVYKIERGTGTFTLSATMQAEGRYHVSFYLPRPGSKGSSSAGGLYFEER